MWGLAVCFWSFSLPISIFLVFGATKSVPLEIEEAAIIDGCSSFMLFWRVVFPLIKPAVMTLSLIHIFFGMGKGYVCTPENSYNINELAFFVADLDGGDYAIHAVTDMDIMRLVVDMNDYDKKIYSECHYRLPFFASVSNCPEYVQDCKGPTTHNWMILPGRNVGRVSLGVCRARCV